ncbi:MAG: hypothetical protein MI922_01915, partial [Bacteroidales bacterium]|nr:hypothetical protein [Bacteroidales bacterium]
KPCSKYRCESLGTQCEFVNSGSDYATCVKHDERDMSAPVVSRDDSVVTSGVDYVDGSGGFSVVGKDGDGCLNAGSVLNIGINVSKLSQCRYDFEAGDFGDMGEVFSSGYYSDGHSVSFSLPNPNPDPGASRGSGVTSDLSLFVKCNDKVGLESAGSFKVDMCVVDGNDTEAPGVVAMDPASGSFVGFDALEESVFVLTSELADCRWDFSDREFFDMENSFSCLDRLGVPSHALGYRCSGALPVNDSDNDYYVRCMDQPWENDTGLRNANAESAVFSLMKPDSKISITKISPSEDYEVGTPLATIDLKIRTEGGGDYHSCSYSYSGYGEMIDSLETGVLRTHEITLNSVPGEKKIYVECRDETGDFARNVTEFNIIGDNSAPDVSRVSQSGGLVKLSLTEPSTCKYSVGGCLFSWDNGTTIGSGESVGFHSVRGERYYVRCMDEWGNAPNGCSIEVLAV